LQQKNTQNYWDNVQVENDLGCFYTGSLMVVKGEKKLMDSFFPVQKSYDQQKSAKMNSRFFPFIYRAKG
jgi:hypothetical protein